MINFIKYETRRVMLPFLTLIVFNLLCSFISIFHINEFTSDLFSFMNSLGVFVIVIYSLKEFIDEFLNGKNVLNYLVPVENYKLILSKLLIFSLLYSLLILSNSLFMYINEYGDYHILKGIISNYGIYIWYQLSSAITGYISGMILVTFCIMVSKLLSTNKNRQYLFGFLLFSLIIILALQIIFRQINNCKSSALIFKSGITNLIFTQYITFLPFKSSGGFTTISNIITTDNIYLTFIFLPITLIMNKENPLGIG